MPGFTGVKLARRLFDTHPVIPVLFTSGYAAGSLTDRGVLADGIELLKKPYSPRELLERVRSVLDTWMPSPS